MCTKISTGLALDWVGFDLAGEVYLERSAGCSEDWFRACLDQSRQFSDETGAFSGVLHGLRSTVPFPDAGGTFLRGRGTLLDGGRTFLRAGGTFLDGGRTFLDGGGTVLDGGGTFLDGGKTVLDGGSAVLECGSAVLDGGRAVPDGGGTVPDGGGTPFYLGVLIDFAGGAL